MSQLNLLRVPSMGVLLLSIIMLSMPSINGQNSYSCDIRANDQLTTESSRRVANQSISVTRGGYNPWSGLQNAELEDSRHISVTVDPHRSSEVLRLSNFDFNLPDNVSITGIQVRMTGNSDSELSPWEQVVRLTDGSGNMIGDNRANHELEGDAWNIDTLTSIGHWTYGSSADLWDASWSAATINNPNFGIALQTKSRSDEPSTFNLDQVIIIVYYDSPILICPDHACVPVSVPFDEDVSSYNWSVQGGISWEPSSNNPNVINVLAEGATFGDYTVCLERVYNDGSRENCCRGISYADCTTGSIGDFVWSDLNGNGFQDAGEPGLSDCRVFLFTESLQFIESVQTVNGMYLFENLAPGNYIVQVDPKEYCPTIYDISNPTLNSDFYGAYLPNSSDVIALSANQHLRDIDFGLIKKGTISGLTWVDKNGNGLYESDIDCTIEDIKISVVNAQQDTILCVYSGPDGTYIVDGVPPGDYTLKFGYPMEYLPTSQGNDSQTGTGHCTDTVTVTEGSDTVVGAGAFRPSTLGNFVWIDTNENGIQDPDEPGIPDATITLYSCTDILIGEYTTDAAGLYEINGLAPGDYKLCVDSGRQDLVATASNVGDDTLDSDLEESGCSACFSILENTVDETLDFGYVIGVTNIDVVVFHDENQNNLEDNNETNIIDVTIELYTCDGQLVQTMSTDSTGGIWFKDIVPASYYIKVIAPAGYAFTDGGRVDGTNGPGTTPCYDAIPPGFTIEVGLYRTLAQIDVYTYNDLNNDGINDGTDLPLEGVGVEIYNCDGTLFSILTSDAAGASWQFDVPQGDYYIRIVPPVGFVIRTGGIITDANGPGTTDCLNTLPIGFSIEVGLIASLAQIDVYTYNDINNDGINDGGDLPLEGVGIEIYNCNGTLLTSLTSDAEGASWQNDVPQGGYYIRIIPPAGFTIRAGGVITNTNGPGTTDCLNTLPIGFSIEVALIAEDTDIATTIGGTIWQDDDGSLDNDNEPGISGVIVSLYDCDDNLIATTETDADGRYLFEDVAEGSYYIRVEQRANFSFAIGGGSGIDNSNGDGTTDCFDIDDNDPVTIDIGYIPISSIGDFVWLDANVDGVQDVGEVGVGDVELILIDQNGVEVGNTITDVNGAYAFFGVTPGSYTIEVRDDRAFGVTLQNVGDPVTDSDLRLESGQLVSTPISIGGGTDRFDIDLGLTIEQAIVGGLVFLDEGLDGILSNADDRIAGIPVHLYSSNGTLAQSLVTDASGVYVFFNVIPGDYYVQFDVTDDYLYTMPNVGMDELFDSDVISPDGKTDIFTANGGDIIQGVNAGLAITSACISGVFWDDLNRDGILDNADGSIASGNSSNLRLSEERRIDNATVNLYREDGTLIASDITDFDGQYSFCDVAAGSYYVEFILPDNYVFTLADQGSDESLDSDVTDVVNGTTDVITVSAGSIISNISAGAYEQSTIVSGTIWYDSDEDGILDPLEEGVSNITINLIDANDAIALTTITNLDGIYTFTDPIEGTYRVELIDNDTLELTQNKIGGDPTVYSHFNTTDNRTDELVIINGNLYENINGGLIEKTTATLQARVSGRVWLDDNRNGLLENIERGLQDMTVNLLRADNTIMSSSLSDSDGLYEFSDVPAGDYRLQVMNEDAYDLTLALVGNDPTIQSHFLQADRRTDMINIVEGAEVNNMHAGLVDKLSLIEGTVWNDTNSNGLYDTAELGVSGVTVNLLDDSGTTLQSIFSDADGRYIFTNIEAGDYVIEVIAGGDYEFTLAYMGGNPDIYSHVLRVNGRTPLMTVTLGQNLNNINAGLVEVINTVVAGRVWLDDNEDGILDSTETGMESIQVELYTENDQLVQTALTTVTGNYSFENLVGGRYYVQFNLIPDHEFTLSRVGGNSPTNSDVTNLVTGTTNAFNINDGQQFVNIHAGLIKVEEVDNGLGSIAGYVWEDINADGTRAADEAGENGIRISLIDEAGITIRETTTANDPDLGRSGYYVFNDIRLGDYTLSYAIDSDAQITAQGADSKLTSAYITDVFSVTAQATVSVDAGYYFPGSIGDFVWNDANRDGIQDAGESGASSFFIKLFDADDQEIGFTFSDSEGAYSFDNLMPGDYYVKVDFQLGISFSPSGGGDEDSDTNINNANGLGTTSMITILSGTTDNSVDIGLIVAPATVGDLVFSDVNANGIQDAGESGINDIGVSLYDRNDNLIETTTTATVGGEDGHYLFEEIPAGNYYIVFDIPSDMDISIKDQGGDDSKDSDVDNSQGYGSTSIFELSAGEVDLDIDAGVVVSLSIGNRIWHDRDADGLDRTNEPGVSGVDVTLYDEDGNYVDAVTSNNQGVYKFSNVSAGDYYIHFGIPDNFIFTTKGDGSNDDESKVNPDGTTDLFSVGSGTGRSDINAGLVRPSNEISGLAWWDDNQDGLYTNDEELMEGVTVWLLDSNRQLLEETRTGVIGRYAFANIPSGQYLIQFVSAPDMVFSDRNVGLDDKIDSDVDADGYTGVINLTGQTVERYVYGGLIDSSSPNLTEVFPNPVHNGQLQLKVKSRTDAVTPEFRLYNLDGQLLESWTADTPQNAGWHQYSIQLNTVQTGQYILRVRTNRTEEIHKIVLVRE